MAKRTFDHEWLPEPNIWDPGSFVPASSQDPPTGAIVLNEAFLNFPSTSAAGMPGIFSCPTGCRALKEIPPTPPYQASYDLAIQDIPLSAHKIVRYIISPASDITIIPMNLRSNSCSTHHFTNGSTGIQETTYLLQSKNGTSTLFTGLRSNVKLDLVLWDFETLTRQGGIYGGVARKFQIDGAVLLDPSCSGQFNPSESPICLLGMDFLVKYPYLLFEPKYDVRGEVDFTLVRGSLVRRPYSTCTEVNKKLVIHISARHDMETGKIGCGVFFKSGSILNLFSGVSKYDKDGNKHTEELWERGILMGIIKALHVVGAFPAGREFTDVIIRTGSPPTNSLLCQMQHTADDLHKHLRNGHDESLDDRFCCPSPNSDLVMYIYRQFIRKKHGFKFYFDGFSTNENYDAVEAAGILASAGAEMEEFYMEKENKSISSRQFLGYSINQFRGHKHKRPHDITLLHQNSGFMGHSIYVSLGLDGYFHIPKARAHMAIEAADKKACSTLSREDAVSKLGYAPWEGEVAAEPNGVLETKNYEYYAISPSRDLRTLDGILGEDAVNQLKNCSKGNPSFIRKIALEIILGSKKDIKFHEFLSMQTKEYRHEYLKELEQRGLEKGWHFCKDKSWNGYLRRNTKIHNEDVWMRLQGAKRMSDGGFALSNEGGFRNWDTANGAHQGKGQETSLTETDAGLNKIRKTVGGGHSRTKERRVSRDYIDQQDNTSTRSQMHKMGIGARVAARHRPGQQPPNGRYINFRNICLDQNSETDESGDLDYRDDRGYSDHSSEYWPDSEDLADSNVQFSRQSRPDTRHWADYCNSDPTGANKDHPTVRRLIADVCKSGLRAHQKYPNPRRLASPFEMAIGDRRKKHEMKTTDLLPLHVSRKHIDLPKNIEKPNPGIKWAEDKWPSFDWMLENFKDDSTTLQ